MVFAPIALAVEPAVAAPATSATTPSHGAAAPVPALERARFEGLCAQVAASYDTARGGFVSKKGVPAESAVELGLLLGRDASGETWKQRSLATLDWTRALMDTTNGGFVTRRQKSGADGMAFEMRTDVNARRLAALITAWRVSGEESYRRDAARVAGFMDRVLLDGRGGFVAAQVGDRTLVPAANGIAIHAWLTWAAATGDARARGFALRSIERVWEICHDAGGVLLRHGDFGEVTMPPQLVDQVEMGRALVLAWHLGGRGRDLERARSLGRVLLEKFEDRSRGGLMTQARPKKDGSIRSAARVAEENARAALFLAELAVATKDGTFRDAARRTWMSFERDQEKAGLAAADWALALRTVLAPEIPARPTWRDPASATVTTPRVIRFRSGGIRR